MTIVIRQEVEHRGIQLRLVIAQRETRARNDDQNLQNRDAERRDDAV